jgi:hypothetical protein
MIEKDYRGRTLPDYNEYLIKYLSWVHSSFFDELSLSTTIRGTQTQLKNGDIVTVVLMKLE